MTIVDDVPRDLVLRVHMQHPTYLLGQIRLAVFARVVQFMKTIDGLKRKMSCLHILYLKCI